MILQAYCLCKLLGPPSLETQLPIQAQGWNRMASRIPSLCPPPAGVSPIPLYPLSLCKAYLWFHHGVLWRWTRVSGSRTMGRGEDTTALKPEIPVSHCSGRAGLGEGLLPDLQICPSSLAAKVLVSSSHRTRTRSNVTYRCWSSPEPHTGGESRSWHPSAFRSPAARVSATCSFYHYHS